jgi:glycosyltransferase involved in cell wall biosynthesis
VNKKFPIRVVEPKWSIYHDYKMPAMSNARNSGIMEARGELLVWVDDNIWFKPDFIQRHVNVYDMNLNTSTDKYYMVGLGWSFPDWNTVKEFAQNEPYKDGKFCREGSWIANNPQALRDSGLPADDPRAYQCFSDNPTFLGDYEIVTGAWCYGRNMSMPRQASLDINGNDEDYDGVPEPQDCDYGLRLNNYGYKTLLDRNCCVYEYKGEDNKLMHHVLPFFWGHIGEVNGIKVTRGEYRIWAIMKTPSRYRANAHFDLEKMAVEFSNNTFRVNLGN